MLPNGTRKTPIWTIRFSLSRLSRIFRRAPDREPTRTPAPPALSPVSGLGSRLLVALLAVGLLVALPACGDDPTGAELDNLTISLTDDHTDEVEAVNVFFEDLTVKRRGEPVEESVPILGSFPNPVDLLTLEDRVIELASASVEAGTYEFIMVNLDQARSNVVEDGVEKPLMIPSEEVKVLGPFTVPEDGATSLTLDFDAEESLVRRGAGGWLLRPVIVIAQTS